MFILIKVIVSVPMCLSTCLVFRLSLSPVLCLALIPAIHYISQVNSLVLLSLPQI